jgi:hypothetical protein
VVASVLASPRITAKVGTAMSLTITPAQDAVVAQPDPPCTCRFSERSERFDPECLYHGENGSMVVYVRFNYDTPRKSGVLLSSKPFAQMERLEKDK